MSLSHNTSQLAQLVVKPEAASRPQTQSRIQITDSFLALKARGFGEVSAELPPGVYRVSVETDRRFEQTVVLLPGRSETVVYRSHRESESPVVTMSLIHEEVCHLAIQAARAKSQEQIIVTAVRKGASSSGKPVSLKGFTVTSGETGKRTSLGAVGQHEPSGGRWALAAAEVAPGGHTLEWSEGAQGVAYQSLWVPRGWAMVIFMPVEAVDSRSDRVVFESMSIHLVPVGGTSGPTEEMDGMRMGESVLRSYREGRLYVSDEKLKSEFLAAGFRNPMLGLIGVHLLLQRQVEVPKAVLMRLHDLAPGHPDVEALLVLMGIGPETPVRWPPMFRVGFTALRDADWAKPAIAPGSPCDRVRAQVHSGGLWTRWHSLALVGATARTLMLSPAEGTSGHDGIVGDGGGGQTAIGQRDIRPAFGPGLAHSIKGFAASFKKEYKRRVSAGDLAWTGLSKEHAEMAVRKLGKEKGHAGAWSRKPGVIRDDPWKGAFGGDARKMDRWLRAEVKASRSDPDWFKVRLWVESIAPQHNPLSGRVRFFLHDTFAEDKPYVNVQNGCAELRLAAWGAFTVGALADSGQTALELDLAELPEAPARFKQR